MSNNTLQIWGNKDSMNLNSMILTNIQCSTYFKQNLYELKTYHEVIDEIYYRVQHLEPWEKGSRRTTGLTGMCGGVRGVGGGGIVSSCFCLLYKLYTLKLTRKQVIGLMNHADSPYIRALGFMYVRYTQNPQDLYSWYADYLDDEEEIDVRAGGGMMMKIGQMLRHWLIRLEWFDTLFPRIPVPIQKEIMDALREQYGNRVESAAFVDNFSVSRASAHRQVDEEPVARRRSRSRSRSNRRSRSRSRSRQRTRTSPVISREREATAGSGSRRRSRSHSSSRNKRGSRSRSRERKHRHKHRKHHHHHHRARSESDGSGGGEEDRHHRRQHKKHKKSREKEVDGKERAVAANNSDKSE